MIRALATEGHRITVATVWDGDEDREAIAELEHSGVSVIAERLPLARSLWNCCRALPSGDPLQAHYSWSPELGRRIAQVTKTSSFDVVHVEHLRGVRYGLALATATAGAATRPPIVWDSVDCISSLFRRAGQESLNFRSRVAARLELSRTERYEGSMIERFARVLVTSHADRNDLMALTRCEPNGAAQPRIEVVANGVDLDYFSTTPEESRESQTLVVTGKMSYHANATAVVRFVKDVMPAVWDALPDTELWVVGKNPGREIVDLSKGRDGDARILVTGTVADIRPFLRKATVSVAPIQYGVGVQNKVLEALACSTPTVATPQAVSALDVESGKQLLVATGPRELSGAIVRLLRDPAERERLGRAGRAFVEQRHDWRRLASQLTGIYRDAIA